MELTKFLELKRKDAIPRSFQEWSSISGIFLLADVIKEKFLEIGEFSEYVIDIDCFEDLCTMNFKKIDKRFTEGFSRVASLDFTVFFERIFSRNFRVGPIAGTMKPTKIKRLKTIVLKSLKSSISDSLAEFIEEKEILKIDRVLEEEELTVDDMEFSKFM